MGIRTAFICFLSVIFLILSSVITSFLMDDLDVTSNLLSYAKRNQYSSIVIIMCIYICCVILPIPIPIKTTLAFAVGYFYGIFLGYAIIYISVNSGCIIAFSMSRYWGCHKFFESLKKVCFNHSKHNLMHNGITKHSNCT